MSAKLLYNLSDENPNLNKQFGCMNGILQVFYRQHYPARSVSISGNVDKSLPPPAFAGERRDHVGDTKMETDKEMERSTRKIKAAKEKHRVSSESSSRPSFSSSPRSSSFSSAEVSTTASQSEPLGPYHGENPIREQSNGGHQMMQYDLKELVKGSINREVRGRGEETYTQQPNSSRASTLLLKESLRSTSRSSYEWNEGRGMAAKLKESHRLSYDERELRNNGYRTGMKLKETPRLSLDSRSNSVKSSRADAARSSCSSGDVNGQATPSHRRTNSSVVAKLMGLDVIADTSETNQNFDTCHNTCQGPSVTAERRENRFCDSPRPISRVEATTLQRSRSTDSMKKIPAAASKFPMEPAPWKQAKTGEATLTVYGEIQKRLTQLEFKKSGKDLRALKQILDAMEKTQHLIDGSKDDGSFLQRTQQPVSAPTSPAINFKSSSIVVMKSAAPVFKETGYSASASSLQQNVALPNLKVSNSKQIRKVTSGKQNAMDLTPRSGLYKGQIDSTKSTSPRTLRSRQALTAVPCSVKSDMTKSERSQQHSVSPKMQPKKLGFERQSRPSSPKPEPGKIQRQVGRQQTESASPTRKQGIKPRSTLQQPDDRLSDASSDLRSLRSDSNISSGSNVDIEVTSRHRLERNYDLQELHTPKQRSPDFGNKHLKPLKVTIEQPSPVSVLDAAFDEEDSPSPVRKISIRFKEDDALPSEESEWMSPKQTESDIVDCFASEGLDFKSGDDEYISEILLASGLLRDLKYSMISIQLNQARLPINPGLFFVLEQNKTTNMTLQGNKYRCRGFRQQQPNQTEKIKRKLVFDTVNEILAQRFAAEGCTKPRLTANPFKIMDKRSGEKQLLQTLCTEIHRLQENKSRCMLEENEEDIIWEDLQSQDMNLKDFEGETPGIVLDIERMIFRDLINEVCFC